MITRTMFLGAAGACWLVALLALVHCVADALTRRRSARYRRLAEDWDAAGPLWRFWVLGGSWLTGAVLAGVAVLR